MVYFNQRGVAETRSKIGGLKSRYGGVGTHVEDPYDEHVFGKSDSAKGMHTSTKRFTDHVRGQYEHAERVLGDVERAMDETEQEHMTTEQVNAEQFER